MPETNLRQTVRNVIPDDPEASAYRFIIVAAKRARQLQSGARSFLPTTSKKPTVVAMDEARRGLVQYDDSKRADEVRKSKAEPLGAEPLGPLDPYAPVREPLQPKPSLRSGAMALPQPDEPRFSLTEAIGVRLSK